MLKVTILCQMLLYHSFCIKETGGWTFGSETTMAGQLQGPYGLAERP